MEIDKITIKERGPTPRGLRKAFNAASKSSWSATGLYFHERYRPNRFTVAHGKEAGYRPRQGDNLPYGSKEFWRSYVGRKLRKYNTRAPLVFTGRTKRLTQMARISATSNAASVRYSGANTLNFHPDLAAEFRKIIPKEARQLGRIYDSGLTRKLKEDQTETVRTF
jgi:hypothetical protein